MALRLMLKSAMCHFALVLVLLVKAGQVTKNDVKWRRTCNLPTGRGNEKTTVTPRVYEGSLWNF